LPLAWFGYRLPRVIRSRVHGDTDLAGLVEGRVGRLMIGSRRENVVGDGIPPQVRWVLTFELFIDYGSENIQGSHGAIHIFVDAAGRLVDHPWVGMFTAESSAGITDLIAFTHPALLAFDELRGRGVLMKESVMGRSGSIWRRSDALQVPHSGGRRIHLPR
jgi:hypothetical protein